MALAFILALSAQQAAMAVPEASSHAGSTGRWCSEVADNRGCCPFCGYSWSEASGKCVHKLPFGTEAAEAQESSYCESISSDGCCKACGYKRGKSGECERVKEPFAHVATAAQPRTTRPRPSSPPSGFRTGVDGWIRLDSFDLPVSLQSAVFRPGLFDFRDVIHLLSACRAASRT